MALEAGIAALKMLYQLAKMIKEARDNVLFVREKLDTTESIEEVIQMQLKRIEEGGSCPEAVLKSIKTRLVTTRRIARRMRMKYEPLVSLLSGLGGSAAMIKAQASMMRRGILGASMALGTLSNMVRGHTDRSQKRALQSFERALKAAGIHASPEEVLADPEYWIGESINNLKNKVNSKIDSSVDLITNKVNSAIDDIESKVDAKMTEGINAIDAAQQKAKSQAKGILNEAQSKMNETTEVAKRKMIDAKGQLDSSVELITNKVNSAIDDIESKVDAKMAEGINAIDAAKQKAKSQAKGILNEAQSKMNETTEVAKRKMIDAKGQIKSETEKLQYLKDKLPGEFDEVNEEEVDAYYDDFNAFDDEVDKAESMINNLRNQQNAVNGKTNEIMGQASQLVSQNQAMANNLIDGQMNGLNNAVDGLNNQFDAAGNKIDSVGININSLKNQQNALKGKADAMKNQGNQLVSQNKQKAEQFFSNQLDLVGDTVAHVVKHQLIVFEKLEELDSRIHNMLDDIDTLVEELKSLDREAADNDDDDSGDKAKRESEMNIVPAGRIKKAPPKTKFIETGLQMIMKDISKGKETLNNEDLRKAFGGGYEEAKLNLFKRHLCPGPFTSYDERIISTQDFFKFLLNQGKPNVGIGIAAICTSLIAKLNTEGMPRIVKDTGKIALDLITPLVAHAFAFGLVLQCEDLREVLTDDPDEIAALQAEADESSMEKRMELIQAFASDFRESFENGVAPDPSLMISIAIEAGTSFLGLGPTTKRRLELMYAIGSICNIEADKVAIEKVEYDMKSELQLMQSLGNNTSHEIMDDLANATFDARRLLGDDPDTQEFWVSSFGKECHEVSWNRFRMSITSYYGKPSRNALNRMKLMLMDMKGNVPLEHIKAFISNTGSLAEAIKLLQKSEKMPRNLTMNDVANDNERPKTAGAVSKQMQEQLSSPTSKVMSPSEKRQAKLRLYGVVNNN